MKGRPFLWWITQILIVLCFVLVCWAYWQAFVVFTSRELPPLIR